MARRARKESGSGYYHIMLRGNNRQLLFLDEADYMKFLACIGRYGPETGTTLIAYCVMDNHAHLLVKSPQRPDLLIKKIASSYVYYFNHKYDRQGHLFQDRYRSEVIDSDAYLLACARYIMRNPEKAGLSRTQDYPWSAWREARGADGLCDMRILIDLIGTREALCEYILTPNDDLCMDVRDARAMSDAKALEVFRKVTGMENPDGILRLERPERDRLLAAVRAEGVSVRQLSRITGIGRNVVQRL